MTKSSGGPGRQPGKPYRDDGQRHDLADGNGYSPDADEQLRPVRRPRRPASARQQEEPQTLAAADQKKRGIALMGDVILAFALSLVILPIILLLGRVIPNFTNLLTQNFIVASILMVRDYLYQGRGVGKNLMGLQVVDYTTGEPPTLIQSLKRNVLFYVPLLLTFVVDLFKFLPFDVSFNLTVSTLVSNACTVYICLLIPAECWFAFKEEGRRIGDKIANTMVVDSSMDFSKPL